MGETVDTLQQLGGTLVLVVCGGLCCGALIVGGLAMALWRSGLLQDLLDGVTGAFGGEQDLLGDDGYIPRRPRSRRVHRSSRYPRAADAGRSTRRRRREAQDADDEIDSFLDEVEIDGEDY